MAITNVYLSPKLLRILNKSIPDTGYIGGQYWEDNLYCYTASRVPDFILPGLIPLGLFCKIRDVAEDQIPSILSEKLGGKYSDQLHLAQNLVLLVIEHDNAGEENSIAAAEYHPFEGLKYMKFELIPDDPFVLLRGCGNIPMSVEVSNDLDIFKENIERGIAKLRSKIHQQVAFLLQGEKSKDLIVQLADDNCKSEELIHSWESYTDYAEKRKKNVTGAKTPLDFDIFFQITGTNALKNTLNHSSVIHCQRRDFQCISLLLPLDVIAVCPKHTHKQSIHDILKDALDRQLSSMLDIFVAYIKASKIEPLKPYHFYPDIWDFPVTLIYPAEDTDQELEKLRKNLHEDLFLPLDRPYLRKLNAFDFSLQETSPYLLNPHHTLRIPESGKYELVHGRYAYHHYMQDRVDDSGWGCAYRSLQTIMSWFKLQGYTGRNVPTHSEIQQALVDVGDKPASFVGSRKWIGSHEVGFCLDHLIQVQSKIVFVSSGSEMGSKGSELLLHFRDQGTPVMIGGGVLAHTILGVNVDDNTGNVKFLILDPHYTGSEEIKTVIQKGWCGWKSLDFWDQTAFYNMCLPQRPLVI